MNKLFFFEQNPPLLVHFTNLLNYTKQICGNRNTGDISRPPAPWTFTPSGSGTSAAFQIGQQPIKPFYSPFAFSPLDERLAPRRVKSRLDLSLSLVLGGN